MQVLEVQFITGGLNVQPTAVILYRRGQASACLVNIRRQCYTLHKTEERVRLNADHIQTNFYEKQNTFTNVVANATIYKCEITNVVATETIAEASGAGGRCAPLMPPPASAEERGRGQSGL